MNVHILLGCHTSLVETHLKFDAQHLVDAQRPIDEAVLYMINACRNYILKLWKKQTNVTTYGQEDGACQGKVYV